MIMNPVIAGGGEKVYKITNKNSTFIFPTQAAAGDIVVSINKNYTSRVASILTPDNLFVPFSNSANGFPLPSTRAGSDAKIYFIMPHSDVTIS